MMQRDELSCLRASQIKPQNYPKQTNNMQAVIILVFHVKIILPIVKQARQNIF
ncbi:Uncharacterised protein [Klebsiella pneumoniae]|nr:Uncharacterised protein [Klebsiella pneumoniae]